MHFDASIQFSSVLYIFYDKIELQKRIKNALTRTLEIKSELIVFLCCRMTIVYSFSAHFAILWRKWINSSVRIEKRGQLQWKSLFSQAI